MQSTNSPQPSASQSFAILETKPIVKDICTRCGSSELHVYNITIQIGPKKFNRITCGSCGNQYYKSI